MNGRETLILLNRLEGLGPKGIQKLLSLSGGIQSVFGTGASELKRLGFSEKMARSVLEAPRHFDLEKEMTLARKEGVSILTLLDEAYPRPLLEIPDAPPVLYVKGALFSGETPPPDGGFFLAMVGSRKASAYGIEMAYRIARLLSEHGFTIVSGLARGIDTASHRGALAAKGRTVAVLGGGLLHLYPSENRGLSREIALSGALVSEFPLETRALSRNFPRRNRIISGLALGVLVVEADEQSGALITAHRAVEQGREVFALPGRIDSPASRGAHRLIQEGAKLVQDLSDIFEELKIPIVMKGSLPSLAEPSSSERPSLTETEEVVYETLSAFPKTIDAIVEETHLPAEATLATLVQLEVKRLVRTYPGKHYARICLSDGA